MEQNYTPQEKEWLRFLIQIDGKFNPSIVDQIWMQKHNLIGENESTKLKNAFFSDQLVSFETMFFQFKCDMNGIQVKVKTFEAANVADSFVKGFLLLLDHSKIMSAIVYVSSHLVSDNHNKISGFFDEFANVSHTDSLQIDKIEDYNFWSDGKNINIGRCPTDKSHMLLRILKRKDFKPSHGTTNECIDFLNENVEFRNQSIDYLVNVKKMIS